MRRSFDVPVLHLLPMEGREKRKECIKKEWKEGKNGRKELKEGMNGRTR
jgi:hypothetical protein